jgi:hypothetical protein
MKRFLTLLSSLHLTVVGLLLLAVLTFWGTVFQVDHGLYAAQDRFFRSWIVLIGGIVPFPGVKLIVALLVVNLIAAGILKIAYSWKNLGIVMVHLGIAVLLAGTSFTHYFAREASLSLREGEQSRTAAILRDAEVTGQIALPVSVTLLGFSRQDYPGSQIVRSYESRIHVQGADIDRDVLIAMNKPFRYRNYTFYQSSYAMDGDTRVSILAVVKNSGKVIPYIATIIMGLGLAIHFMRRLAGHIRNERTTRREVSHAA